MEPPQNPSFVLTDPRGRWLLGFRLLPALQVLPIDSLIQLLASLLVFEFFFLACLSLTIRRLELLV
jgi:hypothetical protein